MVDTSKKTVYKTYSVYITLLQFSVTCSHLSSDIADNEINIPSLSLEYLQQK